MSWKVQLNYSGWRSWRPRLWLLKNYRQIQASWLWFFLCIEWWKPGKPKHTLPRSSSDG